MTKVALVLLVVACACGMPGYEQGSGGGRSSSIGRYDSDGHGGSGLHGQRGSGSGGNL